MKCRINGKGGEKRSYRAAPGVLLLLMLTACGGGGGGLGTVPGGGGTGDAGYLGGIGTAKLSWSAPTETQDGAPLALTDIAGYRINFGPVGSAERTTIDIDDPYVTQYVVTGLKPNTYEFAVTAVDTAGRESSSSNSLTKVIQ